MKSILYQEYLAYLVGLALSFSPAIHYFDELSIIWKRDLIGKLTHPKEPIPNMSICLWTPKSGQGHSNPSFGERRQRLCWKGSVKLPNVWRWWKNLRNEMEPQVCFLTRNMIDFFVHLGRLCFHLFLFWKSKYTSLKIPSEKQLRSGAADLKRSAAYPARFGEALLRYHQDHVDA